MSDLQYRQKKIQDKRKQTPWREFVRDVCSRYQVGLYKNNNTMSRFPDPQRSGPVYAPEVYRKNYLDSPGQTDVQDWVSFFEQLQKFFISVPKMALLDYGINENVSYADTIYGAKNAYISISVWDTAENILYSNMVFGNCYNIVNSAVISSFSENVFTTMVAVNSQFVYYSRYIYNSQHIWFSTNLIGCKECLFCSELENQSYCIHNISYTLEEYTTKKEEILYQKEKFNTWFSALSSRAVDRVVNNCNGNGVSFSENIENWYFISRVQNGRNIFCGDGSPLSENVYDVVDIAKVDDAYAWMWVWQNASHMYCWANASTCYNVYYSYFMDTCSFCLGCIWLKNKEFCIFNKQYTKEERHAKVDEIFEQMDSDNVLGNFFPANMNPFYFNDTLAYLIDPSFSKEEITKLGYLRRNESVKVDIPVGAQLVQASDVSKYESFIDAKRHIDPSILDKIITDTEWNYYRVVKMEYDFLLKHGLPIPRTHRLTRMRDCFMITK